MLYDQRWIWQWSEEAGVLYDQRHVVDMAVVRGGWGAISLVPRPSGGRPGTHCARMRVIIAKFT